MKVYILMECVHYEGKYINSIYINKKDADNALIAIQKDVDKNYADEYDVEEHEVIDKSK